MVVAQYEPLSSKEQDGFTPPSSQSTRHARVSSALTALSNPIVILLMLSCAFAIDFISRSLIFNTLGSSVPDQTPVFEAMKMHYEVAESTDVVTVTSSQSTAIRSLYGLEKFHGRNWIDHITNLNEDGTAPLTKYTQEILHRHQNKPEEQCEQAQYYILDSVVGGAGYGLGATAHVVGWHLGLALQTGRILLYGGNSIGSPFVDESCQDTAGERTMDCVFEPISNCSKKHVTPENSIHMDASVWTRGEDDPERPHWLLTDVPKVFERAIDAFMPIPMATQAKKYWWRGQSTAFVLRLSQASLATLAELRFDEAEQNAWTFDRFAQPPQLYNLTMPFPLPRGSISMHVRHGDKGSEGQLVDFTTFVKAAERLANTNPYVYYKMAFISTEDQSVIDDSKTISALDENDTTPNLNWMWYSSNIPRINGSPFEQLEKFGRSVMTIRWMLQIFLALECDAFIGTRNSNWNQLIDQLRCVWVDKCRAPFIEVGPDNDWRNYWW